MMAEAKARRKDKICYLCEKPVDTSNKDHVVPRQLFGPTPPPNLLTLPTHPDCNQSLKNDEEVFRFFVTAQSGDRPKARTIWDTKIKRSFEYRPQFRKMLASGILPDRKPFYSQGGSYLGEGAGHETPS